MIKVLCPEPESFSEKGLQFAADNFDFTSASLNQLAFENMAPSFDAVLVRFSTRVGREVMMPGSKVKSILSPTTGLDHIDMDAADQNGIKVFHLRGQKAFLDTICATAELSIGLMLTALRKIPYAFDDVKKGNWNVGSWRGHEAFGKVLGIVGCGRLGSKVAKIAIAMGMEVIVFDPANIELPEGAKKVDCLDTLLCKSDVISLHVHLSGDTKHLISFHQFDRMKPHAVLINTSRGSIVNGQALLSALQNGKIRAAAVDVIENEHKFDAVANSLINYANENQNLIITPHIGGATFESVERTDHFIMKRFLETNNIPGLP